MVPHLEVNILGTGSVKLELLPGHKALTAGFLNSFQLLYLKAFSCLSEQSTLSGKHEQIKQSGPSQKVACGLLLFSEIGKRARGWQSSSTELPRKL